MTSPRPYRNQKIASVIEAELARMLAREFHVTGTLVTVLGVTVDDDRLHATVKLGIIPYERAPEVFGELKKVRGSFEHRLLQKMNIRPFPHLSFTLAQENEEDAAP